jgi:hypothetical protein
MFRIAAFLGFIKGVSMGLSTGFSFFGCIRKGRLRCLGGGMFVGGYSVVTKLCWWLYDRPNVGEIAQKPIDYRGGSSEVKKACDFHVILLYSTDIY